MTIRKALENSLSEGWWMYKKTSSGGFFQDPYYDKQIAYNRDDLNDLLSKGYYLDSDAGLVALNIILEACSKETK